MKHIFIIAALLAGLGAAAQERQFAVTDFSVNYLRTAPDYESSLETQELMGTPVEIIGEKGYWRQVVTPQPYTAWCTDLGLAFMDTETLKQYISAPKYIVVSHHSTVFKASSRNAEPMCDLVAGDLLRMTFTKSGKPAMNRKWAYVVLPSQKLGLVPTKDIQDFRCWASSREASAENITATAKQFIGVPYLWGGMSSKGLDCSGLTRLTWFLNGVLLPRNASQQVNTGDNVPVDPDPSFGAESEGLREEMLRRVRNLHPGDLVFFGTPAAQSTGENTGSTPKDRITHVGIYIGDNRIIHSSHMVRINSLIPGDADYYENSHRLIRARRIIGQEDKGKGIVSILNSPAYFRQ